ncbi:sugar ABC transporter substrate-binding protein [Rhodococcus sp. NPDC057529]|uniref:sugar ABC transporter substrate-binding protein n=1 Tax=Rhodococcus sp. NPDC057529 TaxID=3346158 RepID=UPI00366D979B
MAEAEASIAPYTGQPNGFPTEDPLVKRPSASEVIAYLECSTPVCAQLRPMFEDASKALGVQFQSVKAGASAQELQQAMDSIIAMKPSAVLVAGVDPAQFKSQMDELAAMNIPVVGGSGASRFPAIRGVVNGDASSTRIGALLADWAVATNGGAPSVVYTIPELSFTSLMTDGYLTRMKELCPACEVRQQNIPVASIGNAAPQQVVNDLRSHPETETAIFTSLESATGLPAAMKVANLEVDINGFGSDAGTLNSLRKEDFAGAVAFDFPVTGWQFVDMAARLGTGQELTGMERNDEMTMQILSPSDMQSGSTDNWSAYPDYQQRFTALWSAGNAS